MLSFTITGDIEVQRLLSKLATIENEVIIPEIDAWAADIQQGFVSREHVITGRMRASTSKRNVSRTAREVIVATDYAEIENKRPGSKGGTSHNFVEPTLAEQNPRHFDALVNAITRFIGRS
jgi:hypothetical protein